ncbi:MAG TPA: FHA domain-containing protein [Polyangiales bacterium]
MERAIARRDSGQKAPATACVRLTGGSSTHATWMLEDGPGGTAITIGSDPSCDWKIKAASVPPHAVSVLLLSGSVYVRCGDHGGVLLDGRPLSTSWQAVADGARLDIGLARLEVTLGGESMLGDWPRTWVVHNVETPSELLDSSPSIMVDGEAIEARLAADAEAAQRALDDRDDPEISGIRPSATPILELNRPKPRVEPAERSSWFGRRSRPSLADGPSLLGKHTSRPTKLWAYALGCGLTAGAYVLWLAALGH